jgi:asparagine synthase (glutamine-hydrolysing)
VSGIAGIIRFDGGPADPTHLRSMAQAMSHRGPHGQGEWILGSTGLSHLRLCTTAESLEERQPLADEHGTLVVLMDGWLSNWCELREELLSSGAHLRDRSDAELVLRAYELWKERCLGHLDGDFALAIWDARHRRVFLARDHLGNKPLQYRWDGTTLAFASELRAILAIPGSEFVLNTGMVAEIIADEWHSFDETLWKGILRLEPAHWLICDSVGPRTGVYWRPDPTVAVRCRADEEFVEAYRTLFDDVVHRASRTHVPLACEVSGGLDSSAVFATAVHLLRRGNLAAPSVEGHTLSFTDHPEVNDLEYARAVGLHAEVPILETPPRWPELDWYREWVAFSSDFPGYPNAAMSWGIRQAVRSRGSRVLLSGLGGDEWGGSSMALAEELRALHWHHVRELWDGDLEALGLGKSVLKLLRSGALPLIPEWCRAPDRTVRGWLRSPALGPESWLAPEAWQTLTGRRRSGSRQPRLRPARIGQKSILTSLASPRILLARELEERACARVGLEYRHPFWARRMVEFSLALPERLRMRGGCDRVLHRLAMAGRLPNQVLRRRDKADFGCVMSHALRLARAELTDRIPRRRPTWVSAQGVADLFSQLDRHPTRFGPAWPLWNLFVCDALASSGG